MPSPKEKHILNIIGKLYDQMMKTVRETEPTKPKNIILYTGKIYGHMLAAIKAYGKVSKRQFRLALIYDIKDKLDEYTAKHRENMDIQIACDTHNPSAIQIALRPYQEELLVISCRAEEKIPLLTRIIPHVPYLNTPTTESLIWASDKVLMRERLRIHNADINPRFMVLADDTQTTLKTIEEEIGFPLVVKPAGLAASRLVAICYHREELEQVLKTVFKNIAEVYQTSGAGKWEPRVLVEQFIEGDMYSIDAYVNSAGKIYFCPLVQIKTGRAIGFDDFFGYQQLTPTALNQDSVLTAEVVAGEAIHALGLRSTTAHIEMFKTEQGWKIIELGARIGGFRHMLYEFAYGFNHTANDLLIRLEERPAVTKKQKGVAVAMKFFAKQEGVLEKIIGIKKIQDLKSFQRLYVRKEAGDQCRYAKNGGSSVFDLIMFNKDRSELLADIRRVEQTIVIETR